MAGAPPSSLAALAHPVAQRLRDAALLDTVALSHLRHEAVLRAAASAGVESAVVLDLGPGEATAVCDARRLAARLATWPALGGAACGQLVDAAAGTMAPPEAMVDARVVARRLASALAATVAGDVLAVRVASWVDDSGGAFTDVGRKRRAEPPPVAQVEVSAAETHPQTLCGMLCDYPVVRAPSSSAPGSASSVDYALYSAANVGVQFTVPLSVESACSLSLAAWTRRLAQAGVSCARTVGAEGCHVAL